MNILQTAVGITIYVYSQVLLESLVPLAGNIGNFQLAAEHGSFDIESQHDMQVVGGFICLDPDKRRRRVVHRVVELFQGHILKRVSEQPVSLRKKVLPEPSRAPNLVLPEARL